jgi:hypothetical protein
MKKDLPSQQQLSVFEGMSPFLGGRLVCSEAELTREKMLEYLMSIGHVALCGVVLSLKVQTGVSEDTVVEVEMGETTSSVAAVKKRISVQLGFPTETQCLFYKESGTQLLDEHVIDEESSTRTLILHLGSPKFAWDPNSPHMDNAEARALNRDNLFGEGKRAWKFEQDVLFALDGVDPSTVRRRSDFLHQFHYSHTMVALPSMPVKVDETYTLSVSIEENRNLTREGGHDTTGRHRPRIGIVAVGSYALDDRPLVHNATISDSNATVSAWCINTWTGALSDTQLPDVRWDRTPRCGLGILRTASNVLTMQLDFNKRTLRFWLDGRPLGKGFDGIPPVPMQWALMAPHHESAVTIVDTPAELR